MTIKLDIECESGLLTLYINCILNVSLWKKGFVGGLNKWIRITWVNRLHNLNENEIGGQFGVMTETKVGICMYQGPLERKGLAILYTYF